MAKKAAALNLAEIALMSDEEAREYLENVRWPDGVCCVHCGDYAVTKLEGKATRPGVYKCKGCRKQFTVTVGTIFHRSRLGLKKWILAFHLVCSSKKGMSALQLQRHLGLKSYQTAWHMAHRIRHAMKAEPMRKLLGNATTPVEADETYVGGKPRKKMPRGYHRKRGRGTDKAPVVALVERGGSIRVQHMPHVTSRNLRRMISEHVTPVAPLHTDELNVYKSLGRERPGMHEWVTHGKGLQYARPGHFGSVHCNTAESFFALLKRGITGAFHHVSKKHLHRYCDEFAFRWNTRHMTDGERTLVALEEGDGKRLQYSARGA